MLWDKIEGSQTEPLDVNSKFYDGREYALGAYAGKHDLGLSTNQNDLPDGFSPETRCVHA
jgi:hypothetical protein